jgi:hypothetical protein
VQAIVRVSPRIPGKRPKKYKPKSETGQQSKKPSKPRFSKFADMHAKEKGHTDSQDIVSSEDRDDIYIYIYRFAAALL